MTDEQKAGDAPMSIDDRIEYVRQWITANETKDSFGYQLAVKSMRRHLAEMEAQVAERDTQIRAAMEGKPTPIYDKLKAEGLEPPATVMLVSTRPPTDAEIAYGLSLEREATDD